MEPCDATGVSVAISSSTQNVLPLNTTVALEGNTAVSVTLFLLFGEVSSSF